MGEPQAAEIHFHAAKRQSPLDNTTFRFDSGLGLAYCMLGQLDQAVYWLIRSLNEEPFRTSTLRVLAASLADLGQQAEPRRSGAASYRWSRMIASAVRNGSTNLRKGGRFIEGMRLAGLPD